MEEGALESLKRVKHIVLVLSGKGGVGKSSVTTQAALTLANRGLSVGVLDLDLTGPSLPRMFGLEQRQVLQGTTGWIPVRVPSGSSSRGSGDDGVAEGAGGQIKVMSLGFLIGARGNSVVWRGPKKTAMIRQFFTDVTWGELDYLLIDTPPGTSDEHIALAELLLRGDAEGVTARPDGAIIVTTPQQVALADVRKEIDFCRKTGLNILGVIENMAGFICPHCDSCTPIFSSGGGLQLSNELNIPFLGSVPIDPTFVELIENQQSQENGVNLLDQYKKSKLATIFSGIISKIIDQNIASRC